MDLRVNSVGFRFRGNELNLSDVLKHAIEHFKGNETTSGSGREIEVDIPSDSPDVIESCWNDVCSWLAKRGVAPISGYHRQGLNIYDLPVRSEP